MSAGPMWIRGVCAFALMAMLPVAEAADPQQGARLYAQHCSSCHGARGEPDMPGLPNFKRGERLMQSDLNLLKSIQRGAGPMPAYQGLLSETDILNIIAHLRTLR